MNNYTQPYDIVRGIQELAAGQCAPVIFNIKPSNLLIIDKKYARALKSLIDTTGLKARCFEHTDDRQVWFLFREEALTRQLFEPANRAFIEEFGYRENMDLDEMLACAARRFRMYKKGEIDFPHEMGIFLGYPLADVQGFIKHKGRNCLCSGYWKVYDNVHQARETFRLYAMVKQAALDMVRRGLDFGGAENYQFG